MDGAAEAQQGRAHGSIQTHGALVDTMKPILDFFELILIFVALFLLVIVAPLFLFHLLGVLLQ